MESKTIVSDNFWLIALAAKCHDITFLTLISFTAVLIITWVSIRLLFWSYPGGAAWGRYYWFKNGASMSKIPGPRGLPVLGSMSLMTNLAHHKIAAVASSLNAKRLMAYSLGQTRVIVTCNPDVAKEILNSSVFADRPIKESAYSLLFNRAIGFAPYGVYWRTLRRIAATHMFSPKLIKASESQRSEIATQMVKILADKSEQKQSVRVRDVLKLASLNNMMCSVFGQRYELNSDNEEVRVLKEMVDEGYDLLGQLNWSDHLPLLAEFDFQRIRSRCFNLVPKVNDFVNRIIAEHREKTSPGSPSDFVDVLLSLEGAEKLSDSDMVAVLWEMIFRGTDTVSVLIEWILARLVMHKDIQKRVHQELDSVVGKSNPVNESHVGSLTYLNAVIKEVLRMHPPGPLLSWSRLSITDTTVDGHHVPAGTTAMVNMWAICRDPDVWSDPLSFKPERFISSDVKLPEFSIMGSDLRLAPFGSGRRTCPGKSLGLATVGYWVAKMVHEFEWSVQDGVQVDLTELLKLSSEMKNPLEVMISPRVMNA